MILKNDCLLLLTELQNQGIDCSEQIKELIKLKNPTIEILQFINAHRTLDLTCFYEKIRKSYNDKKSSLYINIMKNLEQPDEVLSTLSSYSLQVILFSKTINEKNQFYKNTRLIDVHKCIEYYLKTFDLIPCIKLLSLIKADIKALEM